MYLMYQLNPIHMEILELVWHKHLVYDNGKYKVSLWALSEHTVELTAVQHSLNRHWEDTHNMGTTRPAEMDGPQDQQAKMK